MSGYDLIELKGITQTGKHGVYAHEREAGQPFIADVTLYCELERPGHSDRLADTTNYAEVAQMVEHILSGSPSNLIEAVAIHIADQILEFPKVAGVKVTVHKPNAPVGVEIKDVCVTLWRGVANADAPNQESEPTSLKINSGTVEIPCPKGCTNPEPNTTQAPASENEATGSEPIETAAKTENEGRHSGEIPAEVDLLEKQFEMFETPLGSPHRVVLALGSNQGNSLEILREVARTLKEFPDLTDVKVSALMQTAPVLHENQEPQDDYFNTVITGMWSGSPRELLEVCQSLEEEHGRHRTGTWSPRTLDVDVIDIDGVQVDLPQLTVPHPRAAGRAFVLLPWAMLEPEAKLFDQPVVALAEKASDRSGIKQIWEEWANKNTKLPSGLMQRQLKGSDTPLPTWSFAVEPPEVRIIDDPEALVPVGTEIDAEKPEVKADEASAAVADEEPPANAAFPTQPALPVIREEDGHSESNEIPPFLNSEAVTPDRPEEVTRAEEVEDSASPFSQGEIQPDQQWLPTASLEQVQTQAGKPASQHQEKPGVWKRFVNWLTGEDSLPKGESAEKEPVSAETDNPWVIGESPSGADEAVESVTSEAKQISVEPAAQPVPPRRSLRERTPAPDIEDAGYGSPFMSLSDFREGKTSTQIQESVSDEDTSSKPSALKGDEIDPQELERISRRAMLSASEGVDRERILRPTTTGSIPVIRRKPEA